MDDSAIVELYLSRSENAIDETAKKYGGYCMTVAENILHDRSDSEECVNDTYLRAWNSIPPHKPKMLGTFLGKITRNLAIGKYRGENAQKRGGGQVALALDELAECVTADAVDPAEKVTDDIALRGAINRFLASLSDDARLIFMRRYWYLCSVAEIADDLGVGESRVKMSLLRSREKLRAFLEKEGIVL